MGELGITDMQRKRIFAECTKRGIDEDFRREIIKNVTGKGSLKNLDFFEAALVINRICGEKRKRTDVGGDPRTAKMRKKIYRLEGDLGWQGNPARLAGHMKRMGINSDIVDLTPRECFQIIESLKAVAKRQGIEVDY